VNREVAELVTSLERVAEAMDAEVEAVRSGQAPELSAAADRKRAVLVDVEPILQQSRPIVGAAASDDRARLTRATRRMLAAAERNATTLQGALGGLRRVYACLAEAAQATASSGTYRPDGSLHCVEETVGTIHRSA
jgi:hypothetical protein